MRPPGSVIARLAGAAENLTRARFSPLRLNETDAASTSLSHRQGEAKPRGTRRRRFQQLLAPAFLFYLMGTFLLFAAPGRLCDVC